MEPTSNLHILATWLLDYLRYTCGVLGYLATCLPSIQVDERDEEANMNIDTVNREQSVLILDSSNVADRDHNLESKHKVFLSHSGAQKDFVKQLCVDMERCDRYPFFDKHRSSLPIGEKFPKFIFDAIEQCWVGVVVLSNDFFIKSKWPMLELNAMVKQFEKPNSRIKIIPIFYLISLDEFKNLKNYNQWTSQWKKWAQNDKRINVEEWKRALQVMRSINSLSLMAGCGDVEFREEIVMEVCRLVPPEMKWDDSHVQGRSRSCKVIRDKMDQVLTNSKVCFVGLYGMVGIGKTTISKALCNDLSFKFVDNVCHIELRSGSEMELLLKALKKLSEIRHDVLDKLNDIDLGYAYLKKKLLIQPVFLALDNVQDDYKSLEVAQTYLKAGYGCGSIVLVTARSLDVLKKLNLDESQCLEVPELEEDEARSLFLNYADLPIRHQVNEALLKNCIERCHFLKGDGKSGHYHPLALKVLGQQLGCDTTKWKAQLSKIDVFNLSRDKKHPVFSILRSSFDSLDREHQLVFMDLALLVTTRYNDLSNIGLSRRDWLCMVHEESIEDVKNMLAALKRKSLLEDLSDDFTEIGIHDLWIEFAIEETKAQDIRDRRWVYQVDGKRAALGRSGRGWESVERMCFLEEGWKALKGVDMHDFVNVEAFKLKVEIHIADCTLDLDLSGLKHLKSLDLDTPGLAVSAHGLSSLTNLVLLWWDLTPRFTSCLNGIERLTNLQVLGLWNCKDIDVLDLTELKFLRATEINQFPDLISVRGLSSRMANLRYLLIHCCKSLRECPGVGELYALEVLNLTECVKLKGLPCLERLTNLREMIIDGCKSVGAVPGLSEMVALEIFDAEGCSKLAILPDLVKLTKLQVLDIGKCHVQEVPGLDGLISLTTLCASFGKLSGEQPGFSKLSVLKILEIEGWNGPIWTGIQSLLMLEDLELTECKGEDVVPDLQNLERLKIVSFERCEYKDLSGLSNSTALETLWVYDCDKLERLPEFERLTKLTDLAITGCDNWPSESTLSQRLKKLTDLAIRRCYNLRDWPSESTLCSLKSLTVDGPSLMRVFVVLGTLTGVRNLTLWHSGFENVLIMAPLLSQLEILEIKHCSTMEALDVSIFPQLKELELRGCSVLERVTCSISLTALTELKVRFCESLVEIPDLCTFPQLENLRLEKCRSLTRLSCSRPLTDLIKIKLIGCHRGMEMLDKSRFPNLKVFIEEDSSSHDDKDDDNDDEDSSDEAAVDEGDDCQVEDVADHLS